MSLDTRFRINKGNWDLTLGAVARIHPVYGINPIEDFWVPGESTFQDLAEDFGYASEMWIQGNYVNQDWYDVSGGDSVLIATSNDEFFHHYFGDAIASFNERELEKLGLQRELSAVIGLAYYKYTPKYWLHGWFNCLPYHYGLDDYSYEYDDIKDMMESTSGKIKENPLQVIGIMQGMAQEFAPMGEQLPGIINETIGESKIGGAPAKILEKMEKTLTILKEQTGYEDPSGTTIFIPLPPSNQSSSNGGGNGGSGTNIVTVGDSTAATLNKYREALIQAALY